MLSGVEFAIRDTLKKTKNATVGRDKLLIFHDLESVARNFSVFPKREAGVWSRSGYRMVPGGQWSRFDDVMLAT
jgi:hypothetical protein